jgi:hypothetical protein
MANNNTIFEEKTQTDFCFYETSELRRMQIEISDEIRRRKEILATDYLERIRRLICEMEKEGIELYYGRDIVYSDDLNTEC